MQSINIVKSKAIPMPLPNIDTDQILPKQFLKRIDRTGYGEFLFFDWRYDLGTGTGLREKLMPRHDFVLNKPEYSGAELLITDKNFGCGSSREHAAWALSQYGFRVVIAPTFADIFFSNAGKNGILLITLSEPDVKTLLEHSTQNPDNKVTINLEAQTVADEMGFANKFEIDQFRKYCLLNGHDDIGLTLRHSDALERYESRHNTAHWLSPKPGCNKNTYLTQ